MLSRFRLPRWTLGLLALAAWLAVPAAWWGSRRAVPSSTIYLDVAAGWIWPIKQGNFLLQQTVTDYESNQAKVTIQELATDKKWAEYSYNTNDDFPFPTVLTDGRVLLTLGDKDTIRVRDAVADKDMARIPRKRSAYAWLSFFSDGSKALFVDVNGTTELWDLASGKLRVALPGPGTTYGQFSPDGRMILSYDRHRRSLSIRDADTGLLRAEVPQISPRGLWMSWMDGLLAISVSDGIDLWDTTAGRQVAHFGRVDCVRALSPEGEFLLVSEFPRGRVSLPKWVHPNLSNWLNRDAGTNEHLSPALLDASTGETLATLPGAGQVEFLPDGKSLMAYNSDEHAIRLWDLPPRMRTMVPGPIPWVLLAVALLLSAVWWRGRPGKKGKNALQELPGGDAEQGRSG
jgi:hypothetical protein